MYPVALFTPVKQCKRLLLGSLSTIALMCGSAQAADLAVFFDPSSARDWSGLYMGVQIGGGSGTFDTSNGTNSTSYKSDDGDKTTGGVLMGWNFQHGSVVYGVEGGLSINEIKGTHNGSVVASHTTDYVWHAEARARLGYAVGAFLPYVSAGVLVGEFFQQSAPGATGPTGDLNIDMGYTVGAGVDVRVTPNVTIRSEYAYQNYGDKSYTLASVPTTLKTSFDTHLGRAALIYHFGNPMEPIDPGSASNVLFAGPGLGLYAGVGASQVDLSGYSRGDLDSRSLSGGATVSYLYPVQQFRVGAEAELFMHNGSESVDPSGPVTSLKYDLMWHAALRGKVGYVYGQFMPYVTAGANLGQFTVDAQPNNNTSLDPMKNGFSVGGGVEYAITDRISADLGYSYNSYDAVNVNTSGSNTGVANDLHHVRLGVVVR